MHFICPVDCLNALNAQIWRKARIGFQQTAQETGASIHTLYHMNVCLSTRWNAKSGL